MGCTFGDSAVPCAIAVFCAETVMTGIDPDVELAGVTVADETVWVGACGRIVVYAGGVASLPVSDIGKLDGTNRTSMTSTITTRHRSAASTRRCVSVSFPQVVLKDKFLLIA